MIKQRFKEYFNYTKRERNGIIVLLLILCVLVFVDSYFSNRTSGSLVYINEQFQNEINEFERSLSLLDEDTTKQQFRKKEKKVRKESWRIPETLFFFDPNTANKRELKNLGFSNSQISTLDNYRINGGRFYKKEDLLKVYGIKDRQYKHLEPYILIDDEKNDRVGSAYEKELIEIVELNSASIEEFIKLKGVGESFAIRILKYRDLLGGYVNKKQLLEVYGMDTTRYYLFEKSIRIDTSLVKKLDINKVKFKTLLRHPYINKYNSQSIMKYRELVGKFTRIEQIYENNLIIGEAFIKIKPYLTIQD